MSLSTVRRLPIGAEVQPGGSTHFRVWAPAPSEVALVVEQNGSPRDVSLSREDHGYYSALVPGVSGGDRYWYRLDGELVPDPASRFQPDGPFGPSQVVDHGSFEWSAEPPRLTLDHQVIYEIHVGTFTREGTWRAAVDRLPYLARTGVTVIEVMPIAEFPGRFGWGYDGVFLFAPTRLYGTPDDFRFFVDQAHRHGLAVILDVVYNHLGPDGCVFAKYSQTYFGEIPTEWGDNLNFDGRCSGPVREFFGSNAAYWIDEFHLDGLRLDATQSIHDQSPEHMIRVVTRKAREAAGDRRILIVAENERQHVRLARPPEQGGYGVDMLWNDDFHHSAVVALTGRREAYYSDHRGAPQEFISAAKRGFLFQGQRYAWQKQPRGSRTDGMPPFAFINFLENHDQVANFGDGARTRFRTTPGRWRAMTALMLLMPGTPMLFQGQEFGASAPFLYFADHRPELAKAVAKGRREFVAQFPSLAADEMTPFLPPPHDPATFERCKLDWREAETHATHRRLCEELIAMRRSDAAFRRQEPGAVDGAVLAADAFVLRFAAEQPEDERLLIVNLGSDLTDGSYAEPLVAPPPEHTWRIRWSSEHPDYGGCGTPALARDAAWRIPGHSAMVLMPERIDGRHESDAD